MARAHPVVLIASAMLLLSAPLQAQSLSRYRDFTLGSTVASVIQAARLPPGDVKLIHQRPATIQELRWPLVHRFIGGPAQVDAVRDMVFRFYNDQLFQIVVTYDRQRVEGLTDADLVESLTPIYGLPLIEATKVPVETARALDDETTIARWVGAASSVSLRRGTYPAAVRLTFALTEVETLATAASADAARLDEQEAPQRELDRRNRDAETGRVAVEKARVANKVTFKP